MVSNESRTRSLRRIADRKVYPGTVSWTKTFTYGFLEANVAGWLHEYMVHECLKSSLAFRKPAVAAAGQPPPGQG